MAAPRKSIQSLRFEGVHVKFEQNDPILNRADFEFPMNEIVWIKSSEGAGKSTLLQVLAGLETPTSGRYFMNQDNICEMSFEEFLPYRLNIGYSFDYGGLINNRTLFDNIILPLSYHKLLEPQAAQNRVSELLENFGLTQFAQERPAHVPGRIRKLACLIRAMVTHPQMLLMDDPSLGLGEDTVNLLVDQLKNLHQAGHCQHIFISSYDEKFMSALNYQLVHLDAGTLYAETIDPLKKVVHL